MKDCPVCPPATSLPRDFARNGETARSSTAWRTTNGGGLRPRNPGWRGVQMRGRALCGRGPTRRTPISPALTGSASPVPRDAPETVAMQGQIADSAACAPPPPREGTITHASSSEAVGKCAITHASSSEAVGKRPITHVIGGRTVPRRPDLLITRHRYRPGVVTWQDASRRPRVRACMGAGHAWPRSARSGIQRP